MDKQILTSDIRVMGVIVESFPVGIEEAFQKLEDLLPDGKTRVFYGIADCSNNQFTYKAAALQTSDEEYIKYGLQQFVIQKGEYLAEPLMDWFTKTERIKDVFAGLCKNEYADCSQPMIEVYRNRNEMLCMVKTDNRKVLADAFGSATRDMIDTLSSLSEDEMNTRPHAGGWTVAQVAEHLRKSDTGMLRVMNGPVKETHRDPGKWMDTIKNDFLDMRAKNKSPEFVVPEDKRYEKEKLINTLNRTMQDVIEAISTLNPEDTCNFPFPVYKELTRMEICQFMIYHTKRHTQQMKNIVSSIHSLAGR